MLKIVLVLCLLFCVINCESSTNMTMSVQQSGANTGGVAAAVGGSGAFGGGSAVAVATSGAGRKKRWCLYENGIFIIYLAQGLLW